MKKSNFRKSVMKYAHQLFATVTELRNRATWAACVKAAWNLYHLAQRMRQGVVEFSYRKADGTIRKAFGTLVGIPSGSTLGGKKVTKPSYKTMCYWDMERMAFRCFKVENLISVAA